MRKLFISVLIFAATAAALASDAAKTPIMPPLQPWNGESRKLVAAKKDPWITPAEKADFRTTPTFDETVAWLQKLVAAAPELKMMSIGKSGEGRDIWLVIASKERAFTPESLRAAGKPTILAQGGIHAGEIDGKDAGLMLLRDMTLRGKKDLLDSTNFLFIPILNVDGHERASRYARINQRGPENAGWRTNARNLNLNRDFAKLDTPEVRAVVRAIDDWRPDLFIDIHVTDGADYQYDITYGWNGPIPHSPSITNWLNAQFKPAADAGLLAAGHVPGILTYMVHTDPARGIADWFADPRFSNGYGDARHLPTILVENHSLKPYDRRVLGTYILLESAMRIVGKSSDTLRAAIEEDRQGRVTTLPLAYVNDETRSKTIDFAGIAYRLIPSPISGQIHVEWTGRPITMRMPIIASAKLAASVPRPKAYWIPAAWHDVIDRLAIHGIRFERIAQARSVNVEMYRMSAVKFGAEPYEGRVMVTATAAAEKCREVFAEGSVRVPTDQPLGDLAMLLLEPASPDSFFQWGFFNSTLQRTEYVEEYIMEPMAAKMMAEDPALAKEFEQKLINDAAFRLNPEERLQWFYRKTPFYDERAMLYPVGRE
jgi:murein tripeptide amidase MpaA